ncbi:NAD(P)/FAD-dependent oxidoreductase [Rhizobium sp.]
MENGRAMVVVGAGEAGAAACAGLRELGWSGPIRLIGSENSPPYERPPLSKETLTDETVAGPKHVLSPERLVALDVKLLLGQTVISIDRDSREVIFADETRLAYSRLLLATGASPRRLPFLASSRAVDLRSHDDALRIRQALAAGSKVIVIGGGFIGLEVAASAIYRGAHVTVLESGPRLLTRGVPLPIAELIRQKHHNAGVQIETNASVIAIDDRGPQSHVMLADGREFPADIVVVGIGAIPNSELAAKAGLTVENGIVVDEYLATDDPLIFAAGDCCSFPHRLFGRRLRLEAWRNAQRQGRTAAANILGRQEVYSEVPWFWSDQYDETLQIAGICSENPPIERRLGAGGVMYFYTDDEGALVAACGFGKLGAIAKEVRFAESMIARGLRAAPEALGDAAVNLKTLLAHS